MSLDMALYVPKRSVTGCLTCKRRKKKCDETKPVCRRCSKGGFPCLGYNQPDNADGILGLGHGNKTVGEVASTHPMSQDLTRGSPATTSRVLISSPGFSIQSHQDNTNHPAIAVSGNLQISPEDAFIQEMVPLIMRHYKDLVKHILFNPLAMAIEKALQWRFNSSKSIRWAMYIGARVIEAMSNGDDGQSYMSWVIRFYQHIMASSMSADLDMTELDTRFAVIHDLSIWVFTVLGTSKGYLLFRNSSSFFLKLATLFPQVWSDNGTVSISEVVQIKQYEMKNFILQDTLSALALGIPSVILYDASEPWVEETPTPTLELVYGLPAGIVLLLARINSWRISRIMEQTNPSHSEWQLIEERLHDWSSNFDPTDQASDYITRIAVQECWRQAALIYLYMGMCEANSADPRVQSAVRQVVQLASTVGEDSPLKAHLFIPSLIAGAAARKEKHRAVARSKIETTRNVISMTLRGTDFIPVLDHLWHGSAAGGRPITWEDYVQSRCSVLPIVL